MVSKNNLCSYSPIASIWTAKRIMGYGSGCYMSRSLYITMFFIKEDCNITMLARLRITRVCPRNSKGW